MPLLVFHEILIRMLRRGFDSLHDLVKILLELVILAFGKAVREKLRCLLACFLVLDRVPAFRVPVWHQPFAFLGLVRLQGIGLAIPAHVLVCTSYHIPRARSISSYCGGFTMLSISIFYQK